MKTSAQVIRVSAVRARDSAPSLSSWLDTVQVRPLAGAANAATTGNDETSAERERAAGAADLSFIGFRIL